MRVAVTDSEEYREPTAAAADENVRAAVGIPDAEAEQLAADFCAARERQDAVPFGDLPPGPSETPAVDRDGVPAVVKERLAVSIDAEHLLVAAMFEERVDRMELIGRAMAANKDNPLVVWYAVNWCSKYHEQTGCPLVSWESQLLRLDGQNSEAWIRVAANRLQAGDEQAGLRALQQAASASESRTFWPESIEMFERALTAVGGFSFPERASSAIGMAASNQPSYGDYMNMCREQSAKSRDWAYACLAYGELSQRQGMTVIGRSIAGSIQEVALESLADERLTEVATQNERDRRARLAVARGNSGSETLALSIPSIFFSYLDAFRARGEIEAMTYMREEADRWLALYENVDCSP